MSLIRPGVWDDLMISPKTKINEHGTLELVIKSVESADSDLAAFVSNVVGSNMESNFRIYGPSIVDFNKNVKTASDLGTDLRKIRYQLSQYALLYAPVEVVNTYIGGVKMFEGLGVPEDQYGKAIQQLTNEDWLNKVTTNLFTKFIGFLTAANAYSGTITFRQKFTRQSKEKNWAVIPNSDVSAWIEPMTVPKEQSKVGFTKWEIDNGKDDPNPASSSSTKNTTETDVNAGKNLFGTTTETKQPDLGTTSAPVTAPPVLDTPPVLTAPAETAIIPPITAPPASPAAAGGFFNTP